MPYEPIQLFFLLILMLDEAPWTELVQTDSFAVMTLDLIIYRKPSQVLGVTFKLDPPSTSQQALKDQN